MKTMTFSGLLFVSLVAVPVFAQRGMGDPEGVAQKAVKPALVTLTGKVHEVVTQPCEQTTGRSYLGTHLTLIAPDETELNVHLGPAVRVESIVDQLAKGQRVEVAAFRTDKMPENHYVAQSIVVDEEVLRLRDENLRPLWAGGPGRGNGPQGARGGAGWGRGQGRGPGAGRGMGPGYGYGRGMGPGYGYGRGMGSGYGYGRGMGPGSGYGRGMGAGWRQGGGPGFVDENNDGICDWREMTRWDQ